MNKTIALLLLIYTVILLFITASWKQPSMPYGKFQLVYDTGIKQRVFSFLKR